MDKIIEFLMKKEEVSIENIVEFYEKSIIDAKKIKLFKDISPIISAHIMKKTSRLDMNENEKKDYKDLCQKICGYVIEDQYIDDDMLDREIFKSRIEKMSIDKDLEKAILRKHVGIQ